MKKLFYFIFLTITVLPVVYFSIKINEKINPFHFVLVFLFYVINHILSISFLFTEKFIKKDYDKNIVYSSFEGVGFLKYIFPKNINKYIFANKDCDFNEYYFDENNEKVRISFYEKHLQKEHSKRNWQNAKI
jgi:hypothetical protein